MDRRERWESAHEALLAALQGFESESWAAIPGIIESFNAAKMTAVVQPAIRGRLRTPKGTIQDVTMPLCLDCPVIYPRGGGFTLTFPIKPGDEGILIFASRCIDNHWLAGGVQGQAEFRMHDLSDGFILVGYSSQVRLLDPPPDTDNVQLRSDDGDAFIEIAPDHDVTVQTTGNISGNATGNIGLTAGGNITMTAGGTIRSVATEINTHATEKNTWDAGGTGFVYQVAEIDTYTDGVPSNSHPPNPPEVPT